VTVSSEDMSRCFIVKEALWARLREHFAEAVTYADILCIGENASCRMAIRATRRRGAALRLREIAADFR